MGSYIQTDISTYLSPSVKYLLVDSRRDHLTYMCENNYVTPQLTFKWECISPLFDLVSDGDVTSPQGFLSQCQMLWPVFIECGRKINKSVSPPSHFYQWTNCPNDVEFCFKQIQSDTDSLTPLKSSLLLTSIFENAVGNVYLIKNKHVPFLLRDLLASQELFSVFGALPILVAKALLGTPLAFNVRNVCWHGFPAPQEILNDIAAALLVLISSFGEILFNADIFSLPCRPKMDREAWLQFLPPLESTGFPKLKEYSSEVIELINGCSSIPSTHCLYWTASFNFLCSHRYSESLVLLLPALEHTLRCVFCFLNDCSNRVLVADQHILYTTMDEILDKYFCRSEGVIEDNKLPCILGSKIMNMLIDMLSSFAGPRLRDKLSHGECDLGQIPFIVANHIYCVALLVLMKLDCPKNLIVHASLKEVEGNYCALFHSISILKNQIKAVKEKLQILNTLFKKREGLVIVVLADILKVQSNLLAYSSKFHNPLHHDIESYIDHFINHPVDTLFRSKSDLSVIVTLRKVVSALGQTCDNSLTAVESGQKSLNHHALRSRQRTSYLRMENFIPSLQVILHCIILLVLIQLSSLPKKIILDKFMKNVLRYAENTASLSTFEKNRWMEISNNTAEFCHQCITNLQSFDEQNTSSKSSKSCEEKYEFTLGKCDK